ncbi:MAG: serine hydrolase [Candidatus Aminicenantes bacterium]|nr:serine hydrolase [Candidatus Aminicenantes bacterium]
MSQKKTGPLIAAGWSILLFLFFNVCLHADQAYTHTELTDRVDALFEDWDRIGSPGAAMGIFQDGRIIYARGYGMADLDYNTPITPQTVFRVGSVSKQFTAMCIALLAEQGKISLDDDIRKYFPEMPAFEPAVTIRHMLHHTSGLRDYLILQGLVGRSAGFFYTSPEVLDLLSRQQSLNFTTGDEFSYSNSGYFLLAQIVGRAGGMKTSGFASANIFGVLGMENTHFHDDPKMIVKNRATGYLPREEGGFKIHTTQLDMIGDGGIFTTIEDFFKWDQNFYDNKLGRSSQDLIDQVQTPRKLNDGRENNYAFGLFIDRYRGLKTVSHGGSFVGYKAHYLRFPYQRFSVVIMANCGTFNPGKIANEIADIFLEKQFTEPPLAREKAPLEAAPKFLDLPDKELKAFVGNYYSSELDATAVIRMGEKGLILKLGRHESALSPISSHAFLSTYVNDDAYSLGARKMEFSHRKNENDISFVMSAEDIHDLRFVKRNCVPDKKNP